MSINNNNDANDVRPKKSSSKISRKLQLWQIANLSKTKYAISFENELDYLATTDPGTTVLNSDGRI